MGFHIFIGGEAPLTKQTLAPAPDALAVASFPGVYDLIPGTAAGGAFHGNIPYFVEGVILSTIYG